MIAIIDGAIVQGDTTEMLELLIRKTRSIDELQSNLDSVIQQQKVWMPEEQATIKELLNRAMENNDLCKDSARNY